MRPPSSTATRNHLPGLSIRDGFTRHPFDLKYQVETSGLIPGRGLVSAHPNDRHITAYYGIAPSILRKLLRQWRATLTQRRLRDISFLDFGAGMGRGMLIAAQLPFREVVGIELHPKLATIARRNIDRWQSLGRARCPMRVVTGDATAFEFPANPCVAYLFHPFGSAVLRRVIKRMAEAFAARPGQLDILYVNHEHASVLNRARGFTPLWSGLVAMSPADAAADRRIILAQTEGEYATTGDEACSIYRWTGRG